MNKIKIVSVFVFLAFGIAVFFSDSRLAPIVMSRSTGPQAGRTGAPGETTCTGCHAVNAGPGVLTITAPANYVPGQGYLIQVQHATTDTTRLRWGFELTALDSSNLAAGIFANTSNFTRTITGTIGGNTRNYAEQTSAGTFAGTSGGAGWTFDWTAPATNVGPVTFYAAGIQANNDGSNSGDQTYTAITLTQPAGPACTGDIWTATSTSTPPAARDFHTAVWTGAEMIAWGGSDSLGPANSGSRYNPVTDTWTAISMTNAPAPRTYHTAVWTGTEMIVFGGSGTGGLDLNTGGRYNPTTDTWTPISTTNAPSARQFPQAVWTGSEMIVWGGGNGGGQFDTGARYNPATDTWAAITMTNAPTARFSHSAVWTGSEMIIWGGYNNTFGVLNTGGRYNPVTDAWTATTTAGAPSARQQHTAVWTGAEMIVWGGFILNTGARYDPATNTWTPTNMSGVPAARFGHTTVWTGNEMIVWGGETSASVYTNTGGLYKPSTDSWTAMSTTGAPTARDTHTAVWTGREMIVWGGYDGSNLLNTGGRYCVLAAPAPTPTATYTATATSTSTNTATPANTPTVTPTATNSPTNTATNTPTPAPTPCAPILYASTTGGTLFTININTAVGTNVGSLPTGSATEIEYDLSSGRAFAQAASTYGSEFNITTGAGIGGLITNDHTFTGLEWVGSTLYGASFEEATGPSSLRTLDPWTGMSSLIGATGVGPIAGLAYDEGTTTMYGVSAGTGPYNLLTVNLNTGAATVIGPLGIVAGGLEFGPDGNLYAGGAQSNAGDLYRVNIATGATTLVGSSGFGKISGLANVCVQTPTPTPTNTPTPAGTPSISGTITYGNASAPPKYISNATVTGAGSPTVMATTAAPGGTAGQYTLTGFGAGSYTVSVSKTAGQNSITSNDAARIAQHVTGILIMPNDPQKVSADVSNNGAISSNDAALIARYVAGLGAPIGIAGTWRFFLPPGPTFPVGASPTTRSYADPIGNPTGQDFVGLLMGEVTGNWAPGPLRPAIGPEKGTAVRLPHLLVAAGTDIVVPVSVRGIANKDVISYEFDLRYDPTVLRPQDDPVDVAGTASRGLSVVVNPNEPGLLRVVMYGSMPIDGNRVLLKLRFTAVGTAGSVSPLTWERIMFNEGDPQVVAADGQVELSADAAN